MKVSRKIKLLSLIVLASSVVIIYDKTNHNNINYTALGDGLAKGIDCYGRIDYGYNDYVKLYLEETDKLKEYSIEFTQKDMTIEQLSNTLLSSEKVQSKDKKKPLREVLRDTDYLSMTIGLNDLLYKLSMTEDFNEENLNIIIKEIKTSFDALISEIRKYYSRDIYIVGYYDTGIKDSFFEEAIKKLNSIYKSNKEVIYISTSSISANPQMFRSNPSSYYPNYKGYKLISEKIISKMRKKLEK